MMKAGAIAAGILVIAVLTIALVLSRVDHVQRSESVQPSRQVPPVESPAGASRENAQPSISQLRPPAAVPASAEEMSDRDKFIALPSYDPSVPAGDLQMVRLEVTGSDLRLLGAPVAGDLSERVTADFITDRDGTPYAVRLVR